VYYAEGPVGTAALEGPGYHLKTCSASKSQILKEGKENTRMLLDMGWSKPDMFGFFKAVNVSLTKAPSCATYVLLGST
jgi:hypothetical protein